MRTLSLLVFIISIGMNVHAQESTSKKVNNKLSIHQKSFGTKYFDGTRRIGKTQFADKLKNSRYAYEEYKSGKNLNSAGNIIGFSAGLLFGYSIGASLGGGEKANKTLIAGSSICLGAGLLLNYFGRSKINNAVSIYNRSRHIGLNLNINEYGTGIALQF